MQSLYWLCFVLGGTFVALSAFGGLDGVEFDAEIDTDIELRAPTPHDPSQSSFKTISSKVRFAINVLTSFRFWTASSGFFGLTGLLLSWLYPSFGAWLVFTIALLMGVLLGTAIASTLVALHIRQVDSLVRSTDLAGLMGVVELPFDAHSRGKIRVDVRGTLVDFVARTDEQGQVFEQGDRVLVVGAENNRLWVVSAD
ncbi:MAG: NfeD-like protein [Cyanobacteria bacterium P01_F01_bin.150]